MAHTRILTLLLASVPLASTATAQAPPLEVTYDALDLADRSIPLPALGDAPTTDIEVEIGDDTCTLAIGAGEISGGDCDPLWSQKSLSRLDLTIPAGDVSLKVTLIPREVGGRPAVFDANIPVREGTHLDASEVLPYGGALAVYVGNEWQALTVPVGGEMALDADAILQVSEEPVLAYTEQVGSLTGYFQFWLVKAGPKPKARAPAPASDDIIDVTNDGVVEPRNFDLTKNFCRRARKENPDHFVICVNAEKRQAVVSTPGDANVLKPNTSITVVVRQFDFHGFRVDVDGEAGTFVAGVRIESGVAAEGDSESLGAARAPGRGTGAEVQPRFLVRKRTLAPRLPGPLNVSVEVRDDVGEIWSQTTLELIVEPTYSSALRVGVAGVFLDAVDREYVARTQPGAGQSEVAAVETGGYDLEIVAGFAAFLDKGGRGYSSHDYSRFAPYLGIGLLSQGADGEVDFLKSVHLGVEWELTPTFSLASTVVLRRVTRLAPGVALGGPVQGDVPTVTRQSVGLGFVLNVSPEFLRVGSLGGL